MLIFFLHVHFLFFIFLLSEFALELSTAIPWHVGLKRGSALEEDQDTILVKEEGFFFIYSQVYKFSTYDTVLIFCFWPHNWILRHPNTMLSVFSSLFQAFLFPGLLYRLNFRYGPHRDSYKEKCSRRRESTCRFVPLYSEHESSQSLQHLLHWRWVWKVLLLYQCYKRVTKCKVGWISQKHIQVFFFFFCLGHSICFALWCYYPLSIIIQLMYVQIYIL